MTGIAVVLRTRGMMTVAGSRIRSSQYSSTPSHSGADQPGQVLSA